jgi:hypothetical protein
MGKTISGTMLRTLFVCACLLAPAAAQQFTIADVLNAGSRLTSLSPSAGIPQGGLFVATVRNIGSADLQQATFPLPTTAGLAGVTMQIASQGAVIDAIMVYVAQNEAAAILPSGTPLGPAVLTVSKDGVSATKNINVVDAAFGIFVQTGAGGNGTALAFNVNGDGSTTPNALSASVMPEQDIILNGTGLGAVPSDETQPGVTDIPATAVKVYVGTLPATVVSAGRGTCCDGIDPSYRVPQGIAAWDVIRFTVPDGIVGCYVPVIVQTGKFVSNLALISIDASGGQCNRGTPTVPDDIADKLANKTGASFGALSIGRNIAYTKTPTGPPTLTRSDEASANFLNFPDIPAIVFASDYEYPNYECVIGSYPTPNGGALRNGQPVPIVTLKEVTMDAGPTITIKGPAGTRVLNRVQAGNVVGYRTQANFGNATPGNYLDPGTYTMTGTGGRDIGAFTATITVPQTPFLWTNPPEAGQTIDRTQDYTIAWTGGIPGTQVFITGGSGTIGGFRCAAPAGDGQFTIPSWVLLTLLPTTGNTLGLLNIANSATARFSASGIDLGTINYNAVTEVRLRYQ